MQTEIAVKGVRLLFQLSSDFINESLKRLLPKRRIPIRIPENVFFSILRYSFDEYVAVREYLPRRCHFARMLTWYSSCPILILSVRIIPRKRLSLSHTLSPDEADTENCLVPPLKYSPSPAVPRCQKVCPAPLCITIEFRNRPLPPKILIKIPECYRFRPVAQQLRCFSDRHRCLAGNPSGKREGTGWVEGGGFTVDQRNSRAVVVGGGGGGQPSHLECRCNYPFGLKGVFAIGE